MIDLPTEPGWWRRCQSGWERVADDDADAEIEAGGGFDLVHVEPGLITQELKFD